LDSLQVTQQDHTKTHYEFSEAAKERSLIFQKNPDAIKKRITLINSYNRGKFKNSSQIYIDVNNLVIKFRGGKPAAVTKDSDVETISRSERSYGSQLEYFKDIITLISHDDIAFTPSNVLIKLTELETFKDQASAANDKATIKFGAFKPNIAKRITGFETLNQVSNGIKNMVKAQYGNDSAEYELVKGLNFS